MDSPIQLVLHNVTTAAIISLFDPNPIIWTNQHEHDLRRARSVIERATEEITSVFKTPVNRNSFLLGCLDLTEKEPIEHLFVGYGVRYGSTTKIASVHHALGSEHQVQLSETMAQQIRHHTLAGSRNEVVIFHNHPRNVINHLLDNQPLASNPDRKMLENLTLNIFQICRQISQGGRVLFYLGENGFVREFNCPRLETILSVARLISAVDRCVRTQ